MMTMFSRGSIAVVVVLMTASLVTGCSESPKEKYQDAMQKVKSAKQDRQDAKQTLDKKKQALADAKQAVQEARQKYQKAQSKVDSASKAVDKAVSDALLFRGIQRQLVAKDAFDESAISVSVDHRVVTLSGTVPSDEVRKKAVKIARGKPGVKNVVDSLRVVKSGANDASNGQDKNTQSKNSDGS